MTETQATTAQAGDPSVRYLVVRNAEIKTVERYYYGFSTTLFAAHGEADRYPTTLVMVAVPGWRNDVERQAQDQADRMRSGMMVVREFATYGEAVAAMPEGVALRP